MEDSIEMNAEDKSTYTNVSVGVFNINATRLKHPLAPPKQKTKTPQRKKRNVPKRSPIIRCADDTNNANGPICDRSAKSRLPTQRRCFSLIQSQKSVNASLSYDVISVCRPSGRSTTDIPQNQRESALNATGSIKRARMKGDTSAFGS